MGVFPVAMLYKTTSAAPQVYNVKSQAHVSNHFNNMDELLHTCVFYSDRVLDTSLNGN